MKWVSRACSCLSSSQLRICRTTTTSQVLTTMPSLRPKRSSWYASAASLPASKGRGLTLQIQGDGKKWATDVDKENGSYDYLMFVSAATSGTVCGAHFSAE